MFRFDLLYPNEEKRKSGRAKVRVGERILHDLQLDEMPEYKILTKEAYEILCEEIQYLPTDREVITFRQEILTDFLAHPLFLKSCMELCGQFRDNIARKRYNIWEPSVPVHRILSVYIDLLEHNYQVLCSVHFEAGMKLKSKALKDMTEVLQKEDYKVHLKEIIVSLREFLDAGAIAYHAEYAYGMSLKSVRIQQLFEKNTYVMKKKGIWKKSVVDENHLIQPNGNVILNNNISEIYLKTIVKLCDFASRINSAFVLPFKKIQRELLYYQTSIRLCKMYGELGIVSCMPQITEGYDVCMEFHKLYPFQFFSKCDKIRAFNRDFGETTDTAINNQSPVALQWNDYSNQNGNLVLISGVNSGGKTSFLQSVGIAQIFAQLGFYVPAEDFRASVVHYVGSLFVNMEDIGTMHGKLEKELCQLNEMARLMENHSLILMNEILSSTTEEEGSDIMAGVLRAFSHSHSHVFFVTHLTQLAERVYEGRLTLAEGERATSYVAEYSAVSAVRTYHIVPGKPERELFENELIRHYWEMGV